MLLIFLSTLFTDRSPCFLQEGFGVTTLPWISCRMGNGPRWFVNPGILPPLFPKLCHPKSEAGVFFLLLPLVLKQ